jgi:hypothetical protein
MPASPPPRDLPLAERVMRLQQQMAEKDMQIEKAGQIIVAMAEFIGFKI